jgi:hypothetical protein
MTGTGCQFFYRIKVNGLRLEYILFSMNLEGFRMGENQQYWVLDSIMITA